VKVNELREDHVPILGYVLLATVCQPLWRLVLIWVKDEPLRKFLEYLVALPLDVFWWSIFHLLPESLVSSFIPLYWPGSVFLIEKLLLAALSPRSLRAHNLHISA
jgi:hypothetical protein